MLMNNHLIKTEIFRYRYAIDIFSSVCDGRGTFQFRSPERMGSRSCSGEHSPAIFIKGSITLVSDRCPLLSGRVLEEIRRLETPLV